MTEVKVNNRQAAERLQRLANENFENNNMTISISYEETKQNEQSAIEVDIFKRNLNSKREQRWGAIY